MGLASHLEGILNGLFLVVLGLAWPRLRLPGRASAAVFGLAVYGGFANWAATLLAAAGGAGAAMPIAAAGREGTVVQETVVLALLLSLSAAMLGACTLALWGLRRALAGPAPE